MFETDKRTIRRPKVGRKQVAIRKNAMGQGYVLQITTRTENGYDYEPPKGPVFISQKEARDYRRKYVYKNKLYKGGINHIDEIELTWPLLAVCRHARYRNNEFMCVEEKCEYAAYTTMEDM